MFKIFALKTIYRAFLTGFPILTYNPFTLNSFHTDFTVDRYSTYANYKLNNYQTNYIQNYINNYTDALQLVPIKLDKHSKEDYFISVNIYNCSSPLFHVFNPEHVTRCEINTYVQNKKGENGTLILDYTSNTLSMDPVNLFRYPSESFFKKHKNCLLTFSKNSHHKFSLKILMNNKLRYDVDNEIHRFSDNIFYKNGIIDKLYYDSSLTDATLYNPKFFSESFVFEDLIFDKPYNIFYFNDSINFAGSIWHNLYENDTSLTFNI
jgi:hypothetical protein